MPNTDIDQWARRAVRRLISRLLLLIQRGERL
jgi:hypothetical protein